MLDCVDNCNGTDDQCNCSNDCEDKGDVAYLLAASGCTLGLDTSDPILAAYEIQLCKQSIREEVGVLVEKCEKECY